MHPILFETGSITLYSYGFMIALGIVAGMASVIGDGRREAGLTLGRANHLFLWIFLPAVIREKLSIS